jgi:pimeloyl-ACP methyl ester carboxylesterase
VLKTLTIVGVIEHLVESIRALPEKPIIIGHSFGGLLTQLMLQLDLGGAGVAIRSVPPRGGTTLKWAVCRSLWPAINRVVPASNP